MSSALLLQRRQQLDQEYHHLHQHQQQSHYPTTTTTSSSSTVSSSIPIQSLSLPLRSLQNSQFLAPIPSETDIARLSHSPLSTSSTSSPATSTLDYDSTNDYYMQRPSQGIIQHQSSNQRGSRHPSLEAIGGIQQAFWNQQPRHIPSYRHSIPQGTLHKRTSSDSTIHSAPYTPTSFPYQSYQPYVVDSESQQYSPHHETFDQHHHAVTSIPKSYPQISQPLDHSALFAPDHQTAYYNDAHSQLHWNEAVRQAFLQQQQHNHQYQGQGYSNMENQGDINGSMQDKLQGFPLSRVPGLPRTISAICEDELYNVAEPSVSAPISTTPTTPRFPADGNPSSPLNSVFSQRLQAANQGHLEAARSASPTTSTFSRDKSPFRPNSGFSGSPYDPPTSPGPGMNTAAKMREAQRAEAATYALANAARRTSESSQTVSPKEVSLELDSQENESQTTLFGNPPTPPRHIQHQKRPSRLNQELTRSSTYENLLNREGSSNISNDSMTSNGSQPIQIPQQYPFIRTQRPSNSGIPESSQESNPRFPPTLISMESTRSEKSESRSPASRSPELDGQDSDVDEDDEEDTQEKRPSNTRSDGGTYTCTYHGCTQRFETPQKLQKHKKEGHRQGTPSTNVDARLTQAGPHKCERLNPQTGKPCNSIFSRPYDLTRHEDTIHNARKQKVRCQICTEEKTFSRNDALTRHMRVVHPEVEFSVKTKRGSR